MNIVAAEQASEVAVKDAQRKRRADNQVVNMSPTELVSFVQGNSETPTRREEYGLPGTHSVSSSMPY